MADDDRGALFPGGDRAGEPAGQIRVLGRRRADPAVRVETDRHHRRVHLDGGNADPVGHRVRQRREARGGVVAPATRVSEAAADAGCGGPTSNSPNRSG